MKRIDKKIVEDKSISFFAERRKTVRAIIIKDTRILLVYSYKYNDYMFPGGGVKNGESLKNALKRELTEELGAGKISIIDSFGQIKEKRYSAKDKRPINQKSYYFLCEVSHIGKQHLENDEESYGVKPTWIDIEEALKHNEGIVNDDTHQQKGIRTVMCREIIVLKEIIKRMSNEKI